MPPDHPLKQNKKTILSTFVWSFISFACAVIILISSYFFLSSVARRIDQIDRNDLLTRVQTIAQVINTDDIAALAGNESDLASPSYLRIKNILYNIHDINSATRFVYLMRADSTNTKLIFLADSESPNSKDYSPPGQIYNDTSPLEMQNYINAVSFTEGPYTDEWGTWVSGYAPVWSQGKLVGIIGMDISAEKWRAQDRSFQTGLIIISSFAALAFVLIGIYIRRSILCAWENKNLKNIISKGH